MDKNKLVLPISIILGFIILGFFYYKAELNNQKSIELQQQIEIEENKRMNEIKAEEKLLQDREDKLFLEQKAREDKIEIYRQECLKIKEDNSDRFIDFMNTCTSRGGNTIDECLESEAGVLLSELNTGDFLSSCIENKINKIY